MMLHRSTKRRGAIVHLSLFFPVAHCQRPRALDGIHDGLDHFRGGALTPQVCGVQLEDKTGEKQTRWAACSHHTQQTGETRRRVT